MPRSRSTRIGSPFTAPEPAAAPEPVADLPAEPTADAPAPVEPAVAPDEPEAASVPDPDAPLADAAPAPSGDGPVDTAPDAPFGDAAPAAAVPPAPPADAPPAPSGDAAPTAAAAAGTAPLYPGAAPQYPGAAPQPPYPGAAPTGVPQPGRPAGPDTRPKRLAIIALVLAVVGLVLSAFGFLPFPVVGMIVTILGGILLLVALVLGIIALAVKKHGGTGLSIAAIVVSVLGGIVWTGAVLTAFFWTAFYAAASDNGPISAPTATFAPDGEDVDDVTTDADEQAYLAEVKPQVLAILQTIEPNITEADLSSIYTDEDLIEVGEELSDIPADQREENRSQFISSAVSSSGGAFTEESAAHMFDILIAAADTHLR